MWIVRGEYLFASNIKPKKVRIGDYWGFPINANVIILKSNIFPEITTWETEPVWKRIILEEWIYVDSKG